MDITIHIASYLGILYIVISLAALVSPQKVHGFLQSLRASEHSFFALGVVVFMFGLLITMLHNNWSTFTGVLVGLIGWGAVLESLMYLFLPRRSLVMLYTQIDSQDVIMASAIAGLGLGIALVMPSLLAVI